MNYLKLTTESTEFTAMPEAGPCPRQAHLRRAGGRLWRKITEKYNLNVNPLSWRVLKKCLMLLICSRFWRDEESHNLRDDHRNDNLLNSGSGRRHLSAVYKRILQKLYEGLSSPDSVPQIPGRDKFRDNFSVFCKLQ